MQEMVTEFEKDLKDSPTLSMYYQTIKNSLIEQYGTKKIDIEAMLSVLQGIAEEMEPKDLGHFTYFYMTKNCSNSKFSSEEVTNAKKLIEILKSYIKKCCTVSLSQDERTRIYENSYLPLFSNLGGKKQNYHGKFQLATQWKSYTTNYDDIFEGFWESFHEPETHFDRQGNSNNYIFNANKFLNNQSFAKLHGSLNWTRIKENGNVTRSSISGFATFKTEGEVMLYPIQQKDLYLHPWFSLFQDFKRGLLSFNRWYVIGYAFNDEFIFNVFKESLGENPKELVIINPNAEEIRRKFPKTLQSKIIALPYKFGDDEFEDKFIDFQQNKKHLKFSIETNASVLKIILPYSFLESHVIEMEKGKFESEVNLNDGTCRLDFSIENDTKIKGYLDFDMTFNYRRIEPLDFKFITNSRKLINFDLSSTTKSIDGFSQIISESTDNRESFFTFTRQIPVKDFL